MPLLLGFLGVLGFSFTLPATRAAVDGLVWSAALLNEHIGITTVGAAIAVLASVAATQRAGVERHRRPPLLASRG
jgi:hypothetical protein